MHYQSTWEQYTWAVRNMHTTCTCDINSVTVGIHIHVDDYCSLVTKVDHNIGSPKLCNTMQYIELFLDPS